MKPGIYHDINRSEYEKLPYFNQSTLKKWIELGLNKACPAKFKYWLDHKDEQEEDTAAQTEGSIVDILAIEPHLAPQHFVVIPVDAPKRPTKAQKTAKKPSEESVKAIAWWEKFEAEATGRTVISWSVYDKCVRMAKRLRDREDFQRALKIGSRKTVLIAEMHGHMCKAELDLFRPGTDFIFDVKKTRNAANSERNGFGADAIEYGHHIQAAFYMDMTKALVRAGLLDVPATKFGYYMVEPEDPYETNVLTVTDNNTIIEWGRREYRRAIVSLAHHIETEMWPGYRAFEEVQFPIWAQMQAEEQI